MHTYIHSAPPALHYPISVNKIPYVGYNMAWSGLYELASVASEKPNPEALSFMLCRADFILCRIASCRAVSCLVAPFTLECNDMDRHVWIHTESSQVRSTVGYFKYGQSRRQRRKGERSDMAEEFCNRYITGHHNCYYMGPGYQKEKTSTIVQDNRRHKLYWMVTING